MVQAGLNQKELARKTGLTEAAVSRYLAGSREPRAITVAAIAKALGVGPQALYGPVGEDEIAEAVRLVARNAGSLSEEQREALMVALRDC